MANDDRNDRSAKAELALFAHGSSEIETASNALLERLGTAGDGVIVLLDVSGSMHESTSRHPVQRDLGDGNGVVWVDAPTRYEALCEAAEPLRDKATLVAFACTASEVGPGDDIPLPGSNGGGTDIGEGLRFVTEYRPARTILISDGEPESQWHEREAFRLAELLPGTLETIFVGDETNERAKQFMRDIATKCGGTFDDLSGEAAQQLVTVLHDKLLPP